MGAKLIDTTSGYRKRLTERQIRAIYGKSRAEFSEELDKQRRGGFTVFAVPVAWQRSAVERIDRFLAQAGSMDSLDDLVRWAERLDREANSERAGEPAFSGV